MINCGENVGQINALTKMLLFKQNSFIKLRLKRINYSKLKFTNDIGKLH